MRVAASVLAIVYFHLVPKFFGTATDSLLLMHILTTALATATLNAIGYQLTGSRYARGAWAFVFLSGALWFLALAGDMVPTYKIPWFMVRVIVPAIAAAAATSYLLFLKHQLFHQKKVIFFSVLLLTPLAVGLGAILTFSNVQALGEATSAAFLEVVLLTIIYPTNRVLRCWGYSLIEQPSSEASGQGQVR